MAEEVSGHFDDAKIPLAIDVAQTFAAVLQNEGHPSWAARVLSIAQTLEKGDVRDAVKMFENSSRLGGAGSLSDIFANDESAFNAAWGAYSHAFERLKQKVKSSGDP